jgi:DNA-binding transcriptional LysR family regulator
MELMQLEIFVAIVEEGSMTNAGLRVFRTQPAVSLSLRNLENELGVPLICRPRKYPLVLTPAGVPISPQKLPVTITFACESNARP